MATKKKRGETPKKRGGRRSWPVQQRKEFALRLYAVIVERFGEQAPFERLKRSLATFRAKTRESTVRNWLPPLGRLREAPNGSTVRPVDWQELSTPDVPSLVEVSRVLDVSVDHLLGAAVPRRITDREPIGNPAPALLAYVAQDYLRRTQGRHRDGLAYVLGGRLLERQDVPDSPEYVAAFAKARNDAVAANLPTFEPPMRNLANWPPEGEVLADGRIVTNRSVFGLQLLEADGQTFLSKVCDRVFIEAETWEEDNKESDRQRVRDHVHILASDAAEIAVATHEMTGEPASTESIFRQLMEVLRNPLDPGGQATLFAMARHLRDYRDRRDAVKREETDISANVAMVLLETMFAKAGGMVIRRVDTKPPQKD